MIRWLPAAALAAALAYPFVLGSPAAINIGVLVLLYAALGTAWNILGGYAGQVSFGHAVFFGTGAYTSTLLLQRLGLTPWLGMLAGALVAAAFALVIGYPTFRLAGHYFAIATIVVGEIAHTLVRSSDVVGGARGLFLPILPTALINYQFQETRVPYYFIALALYALALAVTLLIERRRIGYYLRAIREDQAAARSVGVSVPRYKLAAGAVSAALAALCGTFYAQYVLFIDADSVFPLSLSILVALVAILGGAGRAYGPFLGACVLVPLSEITRIQFGGTGRGADLVIYGALIVLVSVAQPGGLAAAGDGLIRRLARAS
ncbi:MAG: branched-chain amino acid ABC transporter permease [Chloroflexota bacterium]|nr:branched-chain amino acid ABC transporter permease [Chloroflexota bacterium]